MNLTEVMAELKTYANENTKKVFLKHGAKEPIYGVKVGDLKKIVKKVKKNHELSLQLYNTGNSDAMYLAGLIANEKLISKTELNDWVKKANWYMISEYTVAWIAAESNFGWELAEEWITSTEEGIASSGWSTFASLATIKNDEELDLDRLDQLLDHVGLVIHESPNRVRYTMNNFVIAVGSCIPGLTPKAKKIASEIGKVKVDVGDTACKVPLAADYITKVEKMGRLGKKKKMARC